MPSPSKIELVVVGEQAGERLDRVIAVVPEVGSRAQAAKLIDQGSVALDGETARKSARVEEGDVIVIELAAPLVGDPGEPAVPFEIIYEDASLLIVDKPSGLVVHPAPGNRTGTLSQALAGLAGGCDPERP